MRSWLIYLPAIASPVAVAITYIFLRQSAKQLQKHRDAVIAARSTLPESGARALGPFERALDG